MRGQIINSIFLYKPPASENFTNTWIYYRVASTDGDELAGTLYAPVQMCRVSWPSLQDIPPMTDTPGVTGLTSAYDAMCNIARGQWGVDHERSVFIGFREG
jgi:hypothetical protein